MKGNLDQAAEFNLKREAENPVDGEIWYEIARFYGLFNMKEDCYRALNKSIDMGYVSYPSMQVDCFLDPVRHDSGIKDLLSKAQSSMQKRWQIWTVSCLQQIILPTTTSSS